MILDQEGKESVSSKQNMMRKCWRQTRTGSSGTKQEGVVGGMVGDEAGGRQGPEGAEAS